MAPLKDVVAWFWEENTVLHHKAAQAKGATGLGKQLQELPAGRDRQGELECKTAEYD